ncbi:MAG: TGS domain-containing protein [Candidatus Nanoarchaeia archaeon]|nr:TGS domain-containing protein [Candidatus Nanoarchaeia archaeon]MDD5588196.1 TGS domain-containing protein [Candidatus Nanoarchaeia archaeon]
MAINAHPEFIEAEKKFYAAQNDEEKLKAMEEMLRYAPKHKGGQSMLLNLKLRYKKLREAIAIQKKKKKSSSGGKPLIKREGAARISIVGMTNSGKSTLLKELTGAKIEIADYEFTTKKIEQGILDYKGVKLQVIEIPAIIKDFYMKEKGPEFLSAVKDSDLVILIYGNEQERKLVFEELYKNDIELPIIYYKKFSDIDIEKVKDLIWNNLNLIYVYTKQPGKKPAYPPIALKKGSKIKDLAGNIHKDFLKKFKHAKIWGKSAKHEGMQAGLNHILENGDIVELHMN